MRDAKFGESIDNRIDDHAERRRDAALATTAKSKRMRGRRTSLISVAKNGRSPARGIA
jgi:hypothetical protein